MNCPTCNQPIDEKLSTNQQRRAFFGIAVKNLADHYGYEKEVMYKALAGAFFGFVDVKIGNIEMKVPASTRGRTKKEFNEFFEYIQRIGSEVGVVIPDPDVRLRT